MTDLNEQIRAEFEKAINDARFFPREIDFTLTKSPSGRHDEYVNSHLESNWNGWQLAMDFVRRQHGSAAQAVAPQLCDYGNADDFVEAYEDWKAQQRNAEVGAMIYNGNTVSYMYSKAKNYGNMLVECCKLLGGEGHVLDRIKALIAERGALRAAPPVADAEGVKELRDALETLVNMAETFPDELGKNHPDVIRARAALSRLNGEKK